MNKHSYFKEKIFWSSQWSQNNSRKSVWHHSFLCNSAQYWHWSLRWYLRYCWWLPPPRLISLFQSSLAAYFLHCSESCRRLLSLNVTTGSKVFSKKIAYIKSNNEWKLNLDEKRLSLFREIQFEKNRNWVWTWDLRENLSINLRFIRKIQARSWKSTLTYAVSFLPVSLFLGRLVEDFGYSIRMRRPNRASFLLKLYILLYLSDICCSVNTASSGFFKCCNQLKIVIKVS